ncbi:hypothetical protein [Paenibacillus polymyxa]|nr:hypothetical protein [Paenibacillus polymyxa]
MSYQTVQNRQTSAVSQTAQMRRRRRIWIQKNPVTVNMEATG